jgi:hypothetical protein
LKPNDKERETRNVGSFIWVHHQQSIILYPNGLLISWNIFCVDESLFERDETIIRILQLKAWDFIMNFNRISLHPQAYNFWFSFHYSLSLWLGHLLVCKLQNFGSWVYQLMIQFIVVSSFFLQDYISFIFSLVFFL